MRNLLILATSAGALSLACGPSSSTSESITDGGTETTTEGTTEPGETTTTTTTTPTSTTTLDEPTTTSTTTVDPPPPACDVQVFPGDHAAAVCPSGQCPISADVELRCADFDFGSPGVRVAPTPDVTWVATASGSDSMLFRVTSDSAQRVTLPARFARSTIHLAAGPGGDLHVAAEVRGMIDPIDADIAYLAETNDWTEETAHVGMAGEPLAGFQVLPDGRPHIWHFGDGPDDFRELVRDDQGAWTGTPVAFPAGGYGTPKFGRDAGGRLLAADMRKDDTLYWLDVEVDGAVQRLGKNFNSSDWQHYFLVPSAQPTPPVGAPFAALIQDENLLEVAWPIDDETSAAAQLSGFELLEGQCEGTEFPDDEMKCPGPCTTTATGFEDSTATLARTPDGLAWAVVVTTQLDTTYEYTLDCQDRLGCFCLPSVVSDATTSTLHVFRVTMDDADPLEVLTLPLPRLAVDGAWSEFGNTLVATHAQAFGDSLAVGLRLHGALPGEIVVRALRIELDALAP
ncbi:hypothetical protein [Nannocystis punicea]|uniref:Uncharacterized protein n=1 Tax=Nannocystis punicea TaxID=2995304 RepID=A0ABY7H7P9_9BACT|nr:hypothetical protein [Nannocystis poenicansa]WAS95276.1 hypothetical protein O0S08_03880 [Nannocystis poenicansa]